MLVATTSTDLSLAVLVRNCCAHPMLKWIGAGNGVNLTVVNRPQRERINNFDNRSHVFLDSSINYPPVHRDSKLYNEECFPWLLFVKASSVRASSVSRMSKEEEQKI